jgi:hypothetical protein
VSGDVPAGRGDVGGPDDAVAAEGQVAQGGHIRGAVPGADLGQVLGSAGDVDPVQERGGNR